MADDYTRPTTPPSATPPVSGIDPYLGTSRLDTEPMAEPRRVLPDRSGGFGSGMLVAAVFVVVAILAAMFFSGRDAVVPATTDGTRDGSDVTIENTVTPSDNGAVATPPAATTDAPAATGTAPAPAADPAAPAPADPSAAPAGQPAAPANP